MIVKGCGVNNPLQMAGDLVDEMNIRILADVMSENPLFSEACS